MTLRELLVIEIVGCYGLAVAFIKRVGSYLGKWVLIWGSKFLFGESVIAAKMSPKRDIGISTIIISKRFYKPCSCIIG